MRSPVYLNALRAFEASARHGSFAGAAAELGVTAAAVGQLVRGLEEWLNIALFHRSSGGKARLVPTEAAEIALPDIRAGFDRLTIGLGRLKDASATGLITVGASPAFAAKWLLPRLERFQASWPDIDVRLVTSLSLADYVSQGIDIGVRYGVGVWPGLKSEKLMEEEIFPVCSARQQHKLNVEAPADLVRHTLIHDSSVDPQLGFATWETWLREAGVEGSTPQRGLKIDNSAAVLQASIDGHGIALARSVLARDDLTAGHLKRLLPDVRVHSALAYYVVYREECSPLPTLQAFRNWLFEEADRSTAAGQSGHKPNVAAALEKFFS